MAWKTVRKYLVRKLGCKVNDAREWFRTPKALGGGGWGRRGKMAGEFVGGEIEYKRIKMVSKLGQADSLGRVRAERAVLRRLGALTGLPVSPKRFVFTRVRKVEGLQAGSVAPPRYQWSLGDYYEGPTRTRVDAWRKKILLEEAVERGDDVSADMVPFGSLRGTSTRSRTLIVRLLGKWGDWGPELSTTVVSGESGAVVAGDASEAWKGFLGWVSAWVMNGAEVPGARAMLTDGSGVDSIFGAVDQSARRVASAAWNTFSGLEGLFRVCV